MPHSKNMRFDLAGFMKAREEARSKVLQENCKLQAEYKKVERVQEKVAYVKLYTWNIVLHSCLLFMSYKKEFYN